jgi:hypothetical protein
MADSISGERNNARHLECRREPGLTHRRNVHGYGDGYGIECGQQSSEGECDPERDCGRAPEACLEPKCSDVLVLERGQYASGAERVCE